MGAFEGAQLRCVHLIVESRSEIDGVRHIEGCIDDVSGYNFDLASETPPIRYPLVVLYS